MNQKKVEQENLILQTRFLIDKLRTNLFMIEDFKDYKRWDNRLKYLKDKLNDIYWRI